MSRITHILCLVTLLAYCAPVRTCVLQEWALGTSCHDTDANPASQVALAVMDADGCIPHPDAGHDESCLCERSKVSPDRPQVHAAAAAGLPPPSVAAMHLEPLLLEIPPFHRTLPGAVEAARSLPLLN